MRLSFKSLLLIAACVAGLGACGGANQGNGGDVEQAKHPVVSQKTTASAYNQVVEQLYVAYFGRPADPSGLANFSAQLAATGVAPTIQAVLQAYSTNNTVKALVDAFGTSTESQSLYGADSPNPSSRPYSLTCWVVSRRRRAWTFGSRRSKAATPPTATSRCKSWMAP